MDIVMSVLTTLMQPQFLLMMLAGSMFGLVFGAIPGLSGTMAIMLMLPLTFSMESNIAMTFLMSVYIGGISGSCIGSILLGIPGANSSIATTYDGYAMTKKGECVRALSAAVVANFLGTVPSVLVASIAARGLANLAVKLGPWEYFSLGVCAIVLVVTLSKGDTIKGILSAAIGLLISCIGMAPMDGVSRFTFGSKYLLGGISLVCVFMGIFAKRNILLEYARKDPTKEPEPAPVSRFKWPKEDLKNNKMNILRSWFTGLWIGFLPGMGAGLSNITAYAQAKNSSKEPEKFGTGIVDGVFAPEVANNASTGGALIPLLALGIPGDTSSSYLIGALTIQGITVGPLLFEEQPFMANLLLMACALAGVMVFIVQVLGMPLFPRILKTPYHYLYSVIILMCFVGVYSNGKVMFNVLMFLVFSLVGLFMAYAGLSTAPFALAFVLGGILETNLRRGLGYSSNGFLMFLERPVSACLLFIAVASLAWPWIKKLFPKKATKEE